MCDADHGADVSDRNAPGVQVGVDVLGNLVWGPAPAEIVANELRHPDHGGVVSGRPGEAGGAQLSKVSVIDGIGGRNGCAAKDGGADHCGNDHSG